MPRIPKTGKEMTTATDTELETKVNTAIAPPRQFKVIYLNDNITTMEFVVESLMTIFHHSAESAIAITKKVHEDGSAVVAVLPYEIAEHKATEVTLQARNQDFPFQVKIEPE